jgi:hypothetical protein
VHLITGNSPMLISITFGGEPIAHRFNGDFKSPNSDWRDSQWLRRRTWGGFLSEQEAFSSSWRRQISQSGIPQLASSSTGPLGRRPKSKSRLRQFVLATQEFLVRWRLMGLAAKNLPLPLQPQTPVSEPILAMGPAYSAGGLFYFPDTFPVPSRDELRQILDDALHGHVLPEHLHGWLAMIRGDNPAKNQLPRYARLFEIQHYYRIICDRHPDLRGHSGTLQQGLAQFLNCREGTIAKDLIFIRQRQGEVAAGCSTSGHSQSATPPTAGSRARRAHRAPRRPR